MAKKNPHEEQLKRALADYQNLKKRVEADQVEFIKYVLSQFLLKLLPVVDDLEAAQSYLKDQGLVLAVNKFKMILTEEGVKEMSLINQAFDPKLADCLELTTGKKDQIIEVSQK